MCGSLRREGITKKYGDVLEMISKDGHTIRCRWKGWARKESIDSGKWNKYKPIEGKLRGWPEYTEKGAIFKVPKGKAIRAIISDDPRQEAEKKLSIVTRPVTMEEIKEAAKQGKPPHDRHPDFVDDSDDPKKP